MWTWLHGVVIISFVSFEWALALSHDAVVVLVHAFVTSRIDNCCSLLAGLPFGVLGRLDRVLRSAARLIRRVPKFSPVSAYMRDVLHWLPISQRISYRTAAVLSRCVLGCAPAYLRDLCRPVYDDAARRALRSTTRGELLIPRARLAIKQRRAFSVVVLPSGNDLPLKLRSLLVSHPAGFYKSSSLFSLFVFGTGALLSSFSKRRAI